jgi:DNA-binding NtrC family response regulator
VDDNAATLLALAEALRLHIPSATVESLSSATAALEKVTLNTYDVIITDIAMPEMDGLTFLKETQRIRPGSVVVVMTARDVDADLEALCRGAFAFVTKPLERDNFITVVGLGLQRASLVSRVRQANQRSVARLVGEAPNKAPVS